MAVSPVKMSLPYRTALACPCLLVTTVVMLVSCKRDGTGEGWVLGLMHWLIHSYQMIGAPFRATACMRCLSRFGSVGTGVGNRGV